MPKRRYMLGRARRRSRSSASLQLPVSLRILWHTLRKSEHLGARALRHPRPQHSARRALREQSGRVLPTLPTGARLPVRGLRAPRQQLQPEQRHPRDGPAQAHRGRHVRHAALCLRKQTLGQPHHDHRTAPIGQHHTRNDPCRQRREGLGRRHQNNRNVAD
ncbi:unnamed protein product [Ixodes persulcatus]